MEAACRRGKTTTSIPERIFSHPGTALHPALELAGASVTIDSKDRRKLSRMTRLIRFLPTARRSTCRETAMPSREQLHSFLRANTLKQRSEETTGLSKTLLNSMGFSKRA
jgi:hypothetical protein